MWGRKKETVEEKPLEVSMDKAQEKPAILAEPPKTLVTATDLTAKKSEVVSLKARLLQRLQEKSEARLNCPYRSYIENPYQKNQFGVDPLTELAWRLTIWKKENVFPIDLKIRAPAVFISSLVLSSRFLISLSRIQQAVCGGRSLPRASLGLLS